ncbi:cupin domain-containing protein [Eubacteriales bacterium OttesenSCG-928-A19]|nr:cupin domain-containing protein [Eubacteriales bacterium OttesenSCG-928-A19]
MDQRFVFHGDVLPVEAGEGVTRRVLAHSADMMLVEVAFREGAVGTTHTHPHEQMTYVLSGRFRFTNDGETRDVGPGDTLRFAPGVEHGTVCLEAGLLLDIFRPARADFL